MPDIFDQLVASGQAPAPQGDIFDAVHALTKTPMAERQIPGVSTVLSGADEPTRQRLLQTGITPGTAMEFAAAHIQRENQQRAARNQPGVDPQQQLAIEDIYKQAAGRQDLSSRDFYAEQAARSRTERGETLAGRFHNAGLAFEENMGDTAYKLLSMVAPETAQNLREDTTAFLNPEMQSLSGKAGNIAAELVKLPTLMKLKALGMGAYFGGSGFGGTRMEAEELRRRGHEVSTGSELKAAAGVGAVDALSGWVTQKLLGFGGKTLDPATKQSFVKQGLKFLGIAASEDAQMIATQAIDNKIRQGINPNVAITEGLIETAVTSPAFTAIGSAMHGGRRGSETAKLVESRVVESVKPEASTVAETAKAVSPIEPAAQAKGLPHPPEGLTKRELLKWAGESGYDVTGLEGKGLRPITSELSHQRSMADPELRKTGEAVQEAMAEQRQLPAEGESWDAGQLRRFADENGYTIDERRVQYLAERQGMKPREAVRVLIEEQYALPKGQGPAGELPRRQPAPPEATVEAPVAPPKRELPTIKTTGKTFKQLKYEAEQLGYDVSDVKYRAELVKTLARQQKQAESGKTIISGDERDQLRQELSATKEQLKQEMLARRTDPKTGAPNEVQYNEDAQRIFADADARNEHVAIVETDVGNLKVMNTVYGHAGGDEMLKMAHEAMREELRVPPQQDRPADYLGSAAYRIGGDEFPAILRGVTSKADVKAAFDRINARFDKALAERFPNLPAEARPFIAWDAMIRKPGSTTPIKGLRMAADEGVEAMKATEKAKRNIPEGRTELLNYVKQSAAVTRTVTAAKAPLTGTEHKRRVPQAFEEVLTPIDSRVRDISPHVYDRLMRMQFNADTQREQLKRELVEPARNLTEALGGKGSEKYVDFSVAVWNQDYATAKALLPAELHADFDRFAGTFRNLLSVQREAGVKIGELEEYWPRYVRDYKALQKVIGTQDKGQFDEAYDLARSVKGRYLLTAEEKADIANGVLQGFGPRKPGTYGPSHARERSIETMTRDMVEHYSDPFESAFRYIDAATYAAERSKFLGRNPDMSKLAESVGNVVQEETTASRLSPEGQNELTHLLRTRFTADMLSMSRVGRIAKQITYAFSLGQFRHAVNQVLDVAMTVKEHGLGNTLGAVFGPKDKHIIMEELGIHDHGEEFKDVNRISKATDRILKVTGFKVFDRIGKEVRINAARAAFEQAAKAPASEAYRRLERDYKPVLGDAFEKTIADLREGRQTEDTRYLMYLDLTKVQPVSLNQMPAQYLKMQNGRILYSMKTFMLKQLDFVRRETFRKIATPGQRAEGLRNLAGLIALVAGGSLAKDLLMDLIRGKPVTADQIPTRSVDSTLGLVGLNSYSAKKLWNDPVEGTVNMVTPPAGFVTSLWKDTTGQGSGQSVKYLPIVGELTYYWFGHGATQNREAAKQEYRQKLRQLWREAALAKKSGDDSTARSLMNIYNDRRKEGSGDGRQRPLTYLDLDMIPATTGERKEQKAVHEEAVQAVRSGDMDAARTALNKYNTGRRTRKTMAQLRAEAGGED